MKPIKLKNLLNTSKHWPIDEPLVYRDEQLNEALVVVFCCVLITMLVIGAILINLY